MQLAATCRNGGQGSVTHLMKCMFETMNITDRLLKEGERERGREGEGEREREREGGRERGVCAWMAFHEI